ncbi:MAG TPA: hypothetical protein VFX33_15720 [Actinomycetales bacterium]|nr:hypothetical protein [Actinomycetales bacterium]
MSPAPAGAHPSPEELDALLDEPVDSPDAARHVESCPDCEQVLSGMRRVRQALREEGARPVTMPSDVQARLQAALARASAERAGTIVPLQPHRGGAVEGERRKARMPRWLTVAAGLLVIGGTATAASQLLGPGGSGASSTAGRAESSAGAGAPSTSVRPLATGTDYEPDKLGSQVDALLALEASVPASGPQLATQDAAEDGQGQGPLADPAGLHACLTGLGATDQAPLAVDLASWRGKDAAVIVLGAPSASDSVQVWVVGRGCAPGDDQLMHYQRVPRQ